MSDLILSPDITAAWAAYLAGVELVAAEVDDRISEKLAGTFPALRITEIATADGTEVDGWASSLTQIDCLHTTRTGAADLARTVGAALRGAGNHVADGVVLGRADQVRRWAAHDSTTFDPPQPRWIVTARLFAKPA